MMCTTAVAPVFRVLLTAIRDPKLGCSVSLFILSLWSLLSYV